MRLRVDGPARAAGLAMILVLSAATAGTVMAGCSTLNEPSAGTVTPVHRNQSPTGAVPSAAVTMTAVPLVDTTRPVVSGGKVLAALRNLPTYVWTPVRAGLFPLVVFVHGYNIGPLAFRRFCSTLASHGYVVAAPSFPLEDPTQGFPLDEAHLADEAADVTFIITALERHSAFRVDGSRVTVVGHSDGADVALLVGYGPGSVDTRVTAVVASAPDVMTVAPIASTVPLLLVQGTADSVAPYSSSQTVYGQVDAPVSYLSLVGADHLAPIAGGSPWTPVLDDAVASFLDSTLAGQRKVVTSLGADLSDSPLVTFKSKA